MLLCGFKTITSRNNLSSFSSYISFLILFIYHPVIASSWSPLSQLFIAFLFLPGSERGCSPNTRPLPPPSLGPQFSLVLGTSSPTEPILSRPLLYICQGHGTSTVNEKRGVFFHFVVGILWNMHSFQHWRLKINTSCIVFAQERRWNRWKWWVCVTPKYSQQFSLVNWQSAHRTMSFQRRPSTSTIRISPLTSFLQVRERIEPQVMG